MSPSPETDVKPDNQPSVLLKEFTAVSLHPLEIITDRKVIARFMRPHRKRWPDIPKAIFYFPAEEVTLPKTDDREKFTVLVDHHKMITSLTLDAVDELDIPYRDRAKAELASRYQTQIEPAENGQSGVITIETRGKETVRIKVEGIVTREGEKPNFRHMVLLNEALHGFLGLTRKGQEMVLEAAEKENVGVVIGDKWKNSRGTYFHPAFQINIAREPNGQYCISKPKTEMSLDPKVPYFLILNGKPSNFAQFAT